MNRIFTTLICIVSVAIISSCGNGASEGEKAAKNVKEKVEEITQTGMFGDKTRKAADAAFKKVGLSVDKLAPGFDYRDEDSIKVFTGVIYQGKYEASAIYVKKDMTDVTREEYEAYVNKIYALTKEIAEDGKAIYGFELKSNPEEAMSEIPVEEILSKNILGIKISMGDWGFKKNGELKRMAVELIDANSKWPARLKVNYYSALQKSFDDTMKDAEKALEDPKVQKELEKVFKK